MLHIWEANEPHTEPQVQLAWSEFPQREVFDILSFLWPDYHMVGYGEVYWTAQLRNYFFIPQDLRAQDLLVIGSEGPYEISWDAPMAGSAKACKSPLWNILDLVHIREIAHRGPTSHNEPPERICRGIIQASAPSTYWCAVDDLLDRLVREPEK